MKEQVGITEKITFTLNGVPIEPGKVPVEAKPEEPTPLKKEVPINSIT